MRKVEIYCNRCRKKIAGDPVQFFNRQVGKDNPNEVKRIVLTPDIGKMDFCKSCAEDICCWIYATSQQEKEIFLPHRPEQAQPARRRTIDTGKVKTLRKAGWSLKAISEEMSCSEQDVSYLLYGR